MKEVIILYGAVITVLIGFLASWLGSRAQVKTALINAEKEIQLQKTNIHAARIEKDSEIKFKELEKMYAILSKIALENSLTIRYMQSTSKLNVDEFRDKYLSNCKALHEIQAMIAIRFPSMLEETNKIYGEANIYWGNQENLLRTDIKNDPKTYQAFCDKLCIVSNEIATLTSSLKFKVVDEAERIQFKLIGKQS